MNQLRIYFEHTELNQFKWCSFAKDGSTQSGDSNSHSLSQLATKASEIIFVVPQQWVYFTSIATADKNTKQLLDAAAYQLEDQLAQDVDDLHFARGVEKDQQVDFVVIQNQLMQALLALEKQANISVSKIIAEAHLCAAAKLDELLVYTFEDHCLLSAKQPPVTSVCHLDQLDFYCDLYQKQNNELKISHSSDDLLCREIELNDCINLKQKKFSQSHLLQTTFSNYLMPLVLLLLWLVVTVAMQWTENQSLNNEIQAINQQQIDLLKKHNLESSGNAKKVVIKALQKQQSGQSQKGFVVIFHRFLLAKKGVSSLQIKKISYRGTKLTVDVSASSFQDLDKLTALLKSNELTVNVDQMNSKDDKSQGRFILELNE